MRGQPSPFQGKVLYSILASLGLFFLCQFGVFTRDMSILGDRRGELEEEIAKAERRLSDLGRVKWARERDEVRLQRRVKDLENRLRGSRSRAGLEGAKGLPTIYLVTPTNPRPTQKADLTRLSYTLMQVPSVMWIVVEDVEGPPSALVGGVLKRSGLPHVHLTAHTPKEFQRGDAEARWKKPRGVAQRNTGLRWLRKNLSPALTTGVVFFMDDDNTYDVRLFQEMRSVSRVGVWPVGLVGELMCERPKVEGGKVVGWVTGWKPERPFPMDMAGFAVALPVVLKGVHAEFSWDVPRGWQESHILSSLGVETGDLEPLGTELGEVLVWHTRTEKPRFRQEAKLNAQGLHSNDHMEI